MENQLNTPDTTTSTARNLPEWIHLEDMGPHLRRVYLAGRILTLGDVQQLPRSEDRPRAAWETALGMLTPRLYREEQGDPARTPLLEVLVETSGGLEVYVIFGDTPEENGATPEELRLSRQAVYDAPRILLGEWSEPAEALS